jgi:four helix bundle protein
MNAEELKSRSKRMALSAIALAEMLPKCQTTDVIGKQLVRSACSVAANYRAVCKARSRADFINKLGVVEEEADETLFWLEMLVDSGKSTFVDQESLMKEVKELIAIFAASRITARRNKLSMNLSSPYKS